MGLDMYFERSGETYDEATAEVLYQYRKHSDLHGWMQKWWLEHCVDPAATDFDFNCKPMRITSDLLVALRDYVFNVPDTAKRHYSGCFWGASTPEDWDETREMLPDLEYLVKAGACIYYLAWW